jgi:hypothetical protein
MESSTPFVSQVMLPFVACYVASAPTRNVLYLGEDRNDVLGWHRMPGQKKWCIEKNPTEQGLPFNRYDNPHITFRHREDRIIDVGGPPSGLGLQGLQTT